MTSEWQRWSWSIVLTLIYLLVTSSIRCIVEPPRLIYQYASQLWTRRSLSPPTNDTEQSSTDHTTISLYNDIKCKEEKHYTAKSFSNKECLNLRFHDVQRTSVITPAELQNELKKPPMNKNTGNENGIVGSMFGLAIGDALGAHVEFRPHDYLLQSPVTDFEAGGTWGLAKGQFTDDTSMALCLANSLIVRQSFDLYDQLVRYKWWFRHGYMSSTGRCFDIGNATRDSIEKFEQRQTEFATTHGFSMEQLDFIHDAELFRTFNVECSDEGVAGNGALMRLAPVPLFFYRDPPTAVEYSGQSGRITHGDRKAYDACRYYGALIVAALHGETKEQLLDEGFYENHRHWFGGKELHPDIQEIVEGSYKKRGGYDDGIRGGGYVVKALEAALWAFWSTGSFEEGALAAVNLGDDTDTTAAIYGQLAGAFYGYARLPQHWVEQVYAREFLRTVSQWITYEGDIWSSRVPVTTSPF